MEKKYEFTGQCKMLWNGVHVRQIRAVRPIHNFLDTIPAGRVGGWIESEKNLSHDGGCWVAGNAVVYGDAVVKDDAVIMEDGVVSGRSIIHQCATVKDHAHIKHDAVIGGCAVVEGHTSVNDNGHVQGNAHLKHDAAVIGHAVVGGNVLLSCTSVIAGTAHVGGDVFLNGDVVLIDGEVNSNDDIDCHGPFTKWGEWVTFNKTSGTYTKSNSVHPCTEEQLKEFGLSY